MKLIIAITALALTEAAVPPKATTVPSAETICGELGVVNKSEVHDTDPSKIRLCKEHPLSLLDGDLSPRAAQDCWFGLSWGCTKGYCWRRCQGPFTAPYEGNASWCWSVVAGLNSDWKRCKNLNDCDNRDTCSGGKCKACGCGHC